MLLLDDPAPPICMSPRMCQREPVPVTRTELFTDELPSPTCPLLVVVTFPPFWIVRLPLVPPAPTERAPTEVSSEPFPVTLIAFWVAPADPMVMVLEKLPMPPPVKVAVLLLLVVPTASVVSVITVGLVVVRVVPPLTDVAAPAGELNAKNPKRAAQDKSSDKRKFMCAEPGSRSNPAGGFAVSFFASDRRDVIVTVGGSDFLI